MVPTLVALLFVPIDMQKRIESATVSLQKIAQESPIDLGDVCAQVSVAIDFSESMRARYPHEMQEAVERGLALTLTGLDDDGVVPILPFHHDLLAGEDLTADNYRGWVEAFYRKHKMGGTNYSPVLKRVLADEHRRRLFGRKQQDERDLPPSFHMFYTDGEPFGRDKPVIEQLLVDARTRPHFVQFIMLGTDAGGRDYLEYLNDELTGPGIDNVGLTVYADQPPNDDVAFFNDVIREFFLSWLPAARSAGITRR